MKYLLLSFIVVTTIIANAQVFQHFDSLQVGDKSPITSSSIFDVKSTTKGALLPRMTTTQRNAISSPPDGLLVWDTTLHSLMMYSTSASGWLLPGASTSLSASKALQTNSSGLVTTSSVTSTELGYLSGSGVTNGGVLYGNSSAFRVSSAGTSGQVLTSAGTSAPTWTTATNSNTASAIVQRDGSGNFTAGTITAALTGAASGNTTYSANNHGVVLSGSGNTMTVIAPSSSTTKVLTSGGASADPSWQDATGGVTAVGTFDSQSASSDGLTISTTNLYGQSADATHPGMINTTSQTMAGAKTFSTSVTSPTIAGSASSGGALTIESTAHATKGKIYLGAAQTSAFDEVNGRLGINTASPGRDLVVNDSSGNTYLSFQANGTNKSLFGTDVTGDFIYFNIGLSQYGLIQNSSGQWGMGNTVPTPSAWLTLQAGDASAGHSPLKISSGTNLTSPESGAIENDGTNLYYTSSSPTRYTLLGSTNGILPIAKGGTNSSTSLNNNRFIVSSGGAIVEAGAVTANRAMASDSNGLPSFSGTTNTELGYLSGMGITAGGVLYTDGAHIVNVGVGTSGQVLSSNASSPPTWITSPGGTGINFVGLSTAFVLSSGDDVTANGSIGNWLAYADSAGTVPVDMTGGSPTTTCLRTTTAGHVLNGAGSIEMVIDAANRQGEGCAVVVNIPPGYRGQNSTFQMAFSVETGTYVSGDLIMSVYDVTNSALLSVSNSTVTGTGLLKASLVIPSSTAQVRIGLHRAVTTASAVTLDFDDVVLGPNINLGTMSVSSDWKNDLTFTPNGFGTISAADYRYKRVGDLMMVKGYFKSGTTVASTCSISLPTGYTIDSSKLTSTASAQQVGWGSRIATSGTPISMFQASDNHVYFYDGSDTAKVYIARQSASNAFTKFNCSSDYANSDGASFEFSVPITQWATNGTTVTPSQVANIWSGYHDNTCSWTVTSTSYADFALDASCALVERVNQNFGTVATSGSVKPAITFTPSRLGVYEVCASGTVADATIAKLVAIRLWDGTTVIAERDFVQAVATDGTNFTLCGNYKATSLSAVTLSLQGQSDAGALTLAAVRATTALEWSLHQIDVNTPMPYFVGAISSPSTTAVEYVMRANLTCSSSSAINNQSGSWISSVGNVSSGKCTVNLTGSPFSSTAYDCSITENGTLVNGIRGWNINNKTTSAFDVYGASISTGSSTIAAITNETFDILCMGAH